MMQGLLTEVIETNRGSQAAAAVAAGGTVIPVEDVSDFPETGGTVDIAGARYEFATVTPGDAGLVFGEGTSEPDPANPTETPADSPLPATPASAGTLTLTAPLTADVTEDDPVQLIIGAEPASDAYAVVDLLAGEGDAPEGGDTVQVPIAYADRAMFLVGPYDPPLAITVDDALTTVLTVPGARPTIDGGTIINLPDDQAPTEPPVESPAVEVHGTADALVVEVLGEYAGSTNLEFHISTTPDFVPAAETLSGTSRSAVFVITEIPVSDGAGGITRSRLQPDTTYYVRTVATNVIGAAEPGPVASGALDPSVVSEIVTARLVAGFILTGSIQAGNITINPETGITIPLSSGGVISLPADGSPATIDAYIHARALNVDSDLSINGYGEVTGDMMYAAGVTTPNQKPTISWGWPVTEQVMTGNFAALVGSGPTVGNVVVHRTKRLYEIDPDSGSIMQEWDAPTAFSTLPNFPAAEDPDVWRYHDVVAWDASGSVVFLATEGPPPGTIPPASGSWGYSPSRWLWKLNASDYSVIAYKALPYSGVPEQAVTFALGYAWVLDLVGGDPNYTLRYSRYQSSAFDNSGWTTTELNVALPSWSTTDTHPDLAFSVFQSPTSGESGYYLAVWADSVSGPIRMFEKASLGSGTWARVTSRDMALPQGLGPAHGLVTTKINRDGSLNSARLVGMDVNNQVSRFATQNWVPRTINARYTWYDGNSTGGTHESLPSPQASAAIPSGQWPVITAPPAPHVQITDPARTDKADRHGIYISAGTDPVRRHSYLALGVNGLTAGSVDAGFARPTASNFTSDMGLPTTTPLVPTTDGFIGTTTDPARLYSQAADAAGYLWRLTGDGTWRLGGLSGSAAGVVSGQGRVQAGVSTYRATANSGSPGARLGTEATPTVWSNSIIRGFTYDSTTGTWTCQAGAAGTYLVFAKASWAADTAADWGCGVQVWKNDVQMGGINDIALHSKALGNSTGPTLLAPIEIAVGDRMQVSIWQNSGTARTPNGMQFYLVPLLG